MATFGNLIKDETKVFSYTAPRQVDTMPGYTGEVVVGIDDSFAGQITPLSIGLCFGPAWKFSPAIRAAFSNRLIDFMSIPYPSYLGGAHISWARMNGEENWGCCLQLVTENTKQGQVHDGDVILKEDFPFQESKLEERYLHFLLSFMEKINNGDTFEPIPFVPTKNRQRFHLPRLNSELQGWIDWSWTGLEIYRFAHAFGAPYPGARTMTKENDNIVLTPITLKPKICSHPFMAGLVIDVKNDVYTIAARDYAFLAKSSVPLRVGQRLTTPDFELKCALMHECDYDANGDRNAR